MIFIMKKKKIFFISRKAWQPKESIRRRRRI